MVEASEDDRKRRTIGAIGAAAIAACIGCCAVPFVAGVVGYRMQRRKRSRPDSVPVALGHRR